MKTMTHALLALAALAVATLVGPNLAQAGCQTDADCSDGQVCLATPCAPCDPSLPPEECPVCENVCAEPGPGPLSECESDADCGEGEICERVALPCTSSPPCPPCACPDCPDGEECEACECPACDDEPQPCDEEPVGMCLPKYDPPICETDADCSVGFSCDEIQVPCAATPCACACETCREGEECPPCECPPCEQEACDPTTYRTCVWDPVECAVDSDCPAGFACQAEEICMGGGSGCACPGCAAGEECPPCECEETEYEETCEVVGNYCAPAPVACSAAADCAEGWVCQVDQYDCACATCACPAPPDCADGDECPEPVPCECPPCECDEGDGEGWCLPQDWVGTDFGPGGPHDPRPATGEGDQATGGDGGSGAGSAPPQDQDGNAAAPGDGSASADPAAGCAATPAGLPTSAPLAGLLLLLLLGAVLYRRARD